MTSNDFRKYYEEYYNIKISPEFDIHHIDLNHSNNNIDNLIMIPKILHNKYHYLINQLGGLDNNSKLSVLGKINILNGNAYDVDLMKEFCEVMIDLRKWTNLKIKNEFKKNNLGVGEQDGR